jgi:hypothetical protein
VHYRLSEVNGIALSGNSQRQPQSLMTRCATLDSENGFEQPLIVALFQVESCAFPRLKIETWGTQFPADTSKEQSQEFMARCDTLDHVKQVGSCFPTQAELGWGTLVRADA